MDGILPLWKPTGMTSHDCVIKARKIFGTKKVGHTGTLDPEVEGVLPICIGQATKIVPFLTETKKTYIAELKLGIATETEDRHGNIIAEKKVADPPERSEIAAVLRSFVGTITQIPPLYSAVKVKGKKLYEYARHNQYVERPERKVTIYSIKQLPLDNQAPDLIKLEVECGKGTYIRTLCVDIGKRLGYPAHMHRLVRTKTGAIAEEDTVGFPIIEKAAELGKQNELLLPIIRGLSHLDKLFVDEETKKRVQFGQKLKKPSKLLKTNLFLIMHKQQLIAIYQIHPENPDLIKAVRVFNGT